MRILLVFLLLLSVGCTRAPVIKVEYVEVKVPVPYRLDPPAALVTPYTPSDLPVFLQPGAGVVSLDEEGVNHLKTILRTLTTRDEAWRVWSTNDIP